MLPRSQHLLTNCLTLWTYTWYVAAVCSAIHFIWSPWLGLSSCKSLSFSSISSYLWTLWNLTILLPSHITRSSVFFLSETWFVATTSNQLHSFSWNYLRYFHTEVQWSILNSTRTSILSNSLFLWPLPSAWTWYFSFWIPSNPLWR